MTAPLSVLAAQLCPVAGDPRANAARLAGVLAEHPDVDLAVFPELFLSGYERVAGAETDLDGEHVRAVRAAAARHRTAILVGVTEALPSGAAANTALGIDADGQVRGKHRKTLLFGPDERAWFEPGDGMTVVALAGWRLGVQICFEMEFPEPARALAQAGADALVTIAANPAQYHGDHALANRSRALDNRLPHVYVNRVGAEGAIEFDGGTRFVDPAGRVEAEAAPGEQVLVHVVEAAEVDAEVDYVRLLQAAATNKEER